MAKDIGVRTYLDEEEKKWLDGYASNHGLSESAALRQLMKIARRALMLNMGEALRRAAVESGSDHSSAGLFQQQPADWGGQPSWGAFTESRSA